MLVVTSSKKKLTKEEAFEQIKNTLIDEIEKGWRDENFDVILEKEEHGEYSYMTSFNTRDSRTMLRYYKKVDCSTEAPPRNGRVKVKNRQDKEGNMIRIYIYTRKVHEPARYGLQEISKKEYKEQYKEVKQ